MTIPAQLLKKLESECSNSNWNAENACSTGDCPHEKRHQCTEIYEAKLQGAQALWSLLLKGGEFRKVLIGWPDGENPECLGVPVDGYHYNHGEIVFIDITALAAERAKNAELEAQIQSLSFGSPIDLCRRNAELESENARLKEEIATQKEANNIARRQRKALNAGR